MPLAVIADLVGGALTGALPLFFAYFVYRLCTQRGPVRLKHELLLAAFVFYLLCLYHITVWRYGVSWADVFSPGPRAVNLVPLVETLGNLQYGVWAFVYNLLGNVVWFVPLGLLLPLCRPGTRLSRTVLTGAAVSLSIELLQLLLRTGITDVDDLIFNALGAALGWWPYRLLFCRTRRRAIFR